MIFDSFYMQNNQFPCDVVTNERLDKFYISPDSLFFDFNPLLFDDLLTSYRLIDAAGQFSTSTDFYSSLYTAANLSNNHSVLPYPRTINLFAYTFGIVDDDTYFTSFSDLELFALFGNLGMENFKETINPFYNGYAFFDVETFTPFSDERFLLVFDQILEDNVNFIDFLTVNFFTVADKVYDATFLHSKLQTSHADLFFEDLSYFDNLTNITSLYHYSIPNTKLAYPEPFVASASFMHTDLWFVHILTYQYWLWFIFIFLIIFFFLTFVSVVRWCNMRVRPRRETRGVSRSKCGDLITACVPVSWATSIIVNESTDAMDFYDGFGTTELVIGVRAYQWGWEYYYPKDIDLNYNIKKNYSTFIGNSLKYDTSSSLNLKTNNLWKFYQNKTSDQISLPAHFLLFSLDNHKLLNFLNFSDLGTNVLYETAAFKKTKSFFKFFPSNHFYEYSDFNLKYKKVSSLYNNDLVFFNSQSYTLKRNHSYLTSSSNNNTNMTFLNYKSFNKFLNYNCANKNSKNSIFTTSISPQNFNVLNIFNIYFTKFFQKVHNSSQAYFFSKNQSHPSLLGEINKDSDAKKIIYPIFKTLSFIKKIQNLDNFWSFKKLSLSNPLTHFQENRLNFLSVDSKDYHPFSSNQSVSTSEKHIRNFANSSVNLAQIHRTPQSNTMTNYLNFENLKINHGLSFFYNVANSNWPDLSLFLQLSSNKTYFDSPNSPIVSNNAFSIASNYDDCKNTFIENVPTILQGKEDSLPLFITSAYWNFYWNNSSVFIRINNDLFYNSLANIFYFPLFNFSYDYDFRNWQSLELLEDSFWDNTFPAPIYEEYIELFNNLFNVEGFQLFEKYNINKAELFTENNFFLTDFKTLEKPQHFTYFNYFDDFSTNVNLLTAQNFSIFALVPGVAIEETYEPFKHLSLSSSLFYKNYLNSFSFYFHPYSYSTVLNMFRSDYEDANWFTNKKLPLNALNLLDADNTKLLRTLLFWEKSGIANIFKHNFLSSDRLDNQINLRSTVKNSMVTYNALQKVFRTRFDEGRSNTKLLDFANFYTNQPYLSSNRVAYENILGKNKTNFYKTNFYKTNFYSNFSFTYNLFLSLNYYIYDFPFLLGSKSDASRHSWFDWFAKWGFYEVQPSSSAKYAIHGLPHFNKFFNFTSSQNEVLNETESYLLRLSKARKNYLPGWTYTPYFYAKNNNWYKNNLFFESLNHQTNELKGVFIILKESCWYDMRLKYQTDVNVSFFPTNSNINSYSKTLWKPSTATAAYYFNVSLLFDILTKREQLYRQYFFFKKNLTNLPKHVENRTSNPLVTEIKTMFDFVDPILVNNEHSREYYYNSLKMFNFYLFKNSFDTFSDSLHDLFFYFVNSSSENYLKVNSELYKNQYRPLKKGINNMLRLHATGAIAMPIEIRLQVLASSKDVIHSWAIPSAGIKIDCVPGYSSHKVMIFLVSGIFWGQCMEICGRYHHWMPIVVYFMKRDLFFLWCTHFVFAPTNGIWNTNDRQYANYIKTVSYDKNSWLTELLN